MPPGGKMSRLFAPSGENAACTRPAEYLPYSKNVACSEIYKHQFIRLTKTDSLNWCLLGSFKHFKKLSRKSEAERSRRIFAPS